VVLGPQRKDELRRRGGLIHRKVGSSQLKAPRAIERRVPYRRDARWSWCEGYRQGTSFGVLRRARPRKRKPRSRDFARQGVSELVADRYGLSQPKGAEGQRQEQGSTSHRLRAGEALAAKNRGMSKAA